MAIDPDKPLRKCPEQQIGVSVPAPLNARLDALVVRANRAGESTSRKEVLAALVLAAPESGEDLSDLIKTYRTTTAARAVPAGEDPAVILDAQERKPGPRTRWPSE